MNKAKEEAEKELSEMFTELERWKSNQSFMFPPLYFMSHQDLDHYARTIEQKIKRIHEE